MADTPHFASPFRLAGSSIAVVEQDTDAEILVCVETILRFPQGSRLEDPDFGRPNLEFDEGPLDIDQLQDAVERYEPRAQTLIEEQPDLYDVAARRVGIDVDGGRDG